MVNAHLDILELELRKLDGVRTVGFSSQHDVLYIQLFIEANAPAAALPFEATRIAQRHSSSPVAVELVRWTNLSAKPSEKGLASIFSNTQGAQAVSEEVPQAKAPVHAGSIGSVPAQIEPQPQEAPSALDHRVSNEEYDETNDIREEPTDFIDMSYEETSDKEIDEDDTFEELSSEEVDLTSEEVDESEIAKAFEASNESKADHNRREEEANLERIALLLVTTSAENDEIEVHLAFDELRTIGRAQSNRGLLGAIDATVQAISELTGSNEFHAEWARSLEPGAEHASLVAVGLTNAEGTDTRHGIAGGTSPIEAAARATLNALNRTAVLAASDQ